MKGVKRLNDKINKELKNTEFRKAFDEEEIFTSIAVSLAKLREKEGLTQTDLAKRMHTSQQMVARLENLSNKSFSLRTLAKAAQALNKRLVIKFI